MLGHLLAEQLVHTEVVVRVSGRGGSLVTGQYNCDPSVRACVRLSPAAACGGAVQQKRDPGPLRCQAGAARLGLSEQGTSV